MGAITILFLSNCIGGEFFVSSPLHGRVAIHPRVGRRVIFDGSLEHGVVAVRSPDIPRYSLTMDWQPTSYFDRRLLILSNDELEVTPEFFACLKQIFNAFDKDQDGCWNLQELSAYLEATQSEVSPRMFEEICKADPYFSVGATQPAGDRSVCFEGVVNLYRNLAISSPPQVWADLQFLAAVIKLVLPGAS